MTSRKVVVGTRGSALARWQSGYVAARLRAAHPGLEVEEAVIHTRGDQDLRSSIPQLGGKGVFTEEIQAALREGTIHLAVHSAKDLPTGPTPGLCLGAFPERADPRDAWVSRAGRVFASLEQGGAVATGSLRRQAQLRHRFPKLRVEPVRGNVGTRLHKLDAGSWDGMILAAAGLDRLGLGERIAERLAPEDFLPSPAQGVLAVEIRDDHASRDLVAPLDDAETRIAVTAERALLERVEGGCLVPLAALARVDGGELVLDALIADPDGGRLVRRARRGSVSAPEALGVALGQELLDAGGAEILADLEQLG